jgi:hyperosmotically inducible periplasmic protein
MCILACIARQLRAATDVHYELRMLKTRNLIAAAMVLFVSTCLSVPARAQADGQVKPDNTKVNQRDKDPGQATADQQKMNAADRDLTAKIRKAVMADKGLSTYAHNIKIISQNGTVTLKGPVHSDEEVKSIMAKATDAAGGPDKVVNQMSVKP